MGDPLKKLTIAENIVKEIQSLVPPGRFLKKTKRLGSTKSFEKWVWKDIGEEATIAKTRQALRVGANEIKKRRNAIRRASTTMEYSMKEVGVQHFVPKATLVHYSRSSSSFLHLPGRFHPPSLYLVTSISSNVLKGSAIDQEKRVGMRDHSIRWFPLQNVVSHHLNLIVTFAFLLYLRRI